MADITDPEKASLIVVSQHCDTNLSFEGACTKPKKARVSIPISLLVWLGVVVCVTKSAVFLGLVADTHLSRHTVQAHSHICAQPASKGTPSNWTELYAYDGFAKENADRLSGAVRIPTQ